jgi:hypothetical protein
LLLHIAACNISELNASKFASFAFPAMIFLALPEIDPYFTFPDSGL